MDKPENSQSIKTILILCIALVVCFLKTGEKYFLFVSTFLGIIGVLFNKLSILIHVLWIQFGELLASIVPKVILVIVFYLFLFPIALLSRFFRKDDPLSLKKSNESLFVDCQKKFDEKSFVDPW